MINSIKYLNNCALINNQVKVQIQQNGEIKAKYDKNTIKEMDALNLVEEYLKLYRTRLQN